MLSKAEKEAGYKAVPQPNPQQVAVLRRVAAGYLTVTLTADQLGPVYTYDDGSRMSHLGKPGNSQEAAVATMVRHGWLIPVKGETLLGDDDPPQRYRARTTDDGPTPRWIAPHKH